MVTKLLVSVFAVFFLTLSAWGDTLEISIKGARNSDGMFRFNICQADEYDLAVKAHSKCRFDHYAIASEGTFTTISGLPQGQYAIMVLHDENSDGETGFFGPIPTEGFGFSKNPSVIFGAPSFNDVMIDVEGSVSITVEMRYFL